MSDGGVILREVPGHVQGDLQQDRRSFRIFVDGGLPADWPASPEWEEARTVLPARPTDLLHIVEIGSPPSCDPTEETLGEIARSLGVTRQATKRKRVFAFVFAALLLLAIAAMAFAWFALEKKQLAEKIQKLAERSLREARIKTARLYGTLAVNAIQNVDGGRGIASYRKGILYAMAAARTEIPGEINALPTDRVARAQPMNDRIEGSEEELPLRTDALSMFKDPGILAAFSERWTSPGWPLDTTTVAVALSPDGSRLASAHGQAMGQLDGRVRVLPAQAAIPWVFDLRQGRIAQPFDGQGHLKPMTALAYSPDGRFLATASLDTTVVLWGIPEMAQLRTLQVRKGSATALAFTRAGLLASGTRTPANWSPASPARRAR